LRGSINPNSNLRGKRPATGAQRRKMFGVGNPRKSIKGTRRVSKERPRTAGMQLNSGSRPKEEAEDPILALLRQETQSAERVKEESKEES